MPSSVQKHIKTTAREIEWHGEGSLPHREDGPAIVFPNGDREWWIEGELHRDSGPAVMRADGSCEWWLNGRPWPEGQVQAAENLMMRREREKALAQLRAHRHTRFKL
jgi:hypothetical protein